MNINPLEFDYIQQVSEEKMCDYLKEVRLSI